MAQLFDNVLSSEEDGCYGNEQDCCQEAEKAECEAAECADGVCEEECVEEVCEAECAEDVCEVAECEESAAPVAGDAELTVVERMVRIEELQANIVELKLCLQAAFDKIGGAANEMTPDKEDEYDHCMTEIKSLTKAYELVSEDIRTSKAELERLKVQCCCMRALEEVRKYCWDCGSRVGDIGVACRSCSARNKEDYKFCQNCATEYKELADNECYACGEVIPLAMPGIFCFCPRCGARHGGA